MTQRLAVLGSTGSVGTQTLDVVRASPDAYDVVALGAGRSVAKLIEQAREFRPSIVAIADSGLARELEEALPDVTVLAGPSALADAAADVDVVLNAVVGFAGLPVTMRALESGQRLALANKESLIAAGPVVQAARATPGAEIVPVDSEHCALHQCLRSNESEHDRMEQVSRLVVTASGGPFRGRTAEDLQAVTVDEALAHPTWSMGPKITVDSSTLMNKGLEVIEANELFGVGFDRIDVVVHPQSIVHSMVTFTDGATIAQLSMPDMRLCIAYALDYPERHAMPYGGIDFGQPQSLTFESPDRDAFPCLDLSYDAGRRGGAAPATLSAANEIAVEAFLEGRIRWIDIARVNEAVLTRHNDVVITTIDDVLAADAQARREAADHVTALAEKV